MPLFELPALPYDYNALSPAISATIMQLHHDKHHQAYVDKLNKAIAGHEANLQALFVPGKPAVEALLCALPTLPNDFSDSLRTELRHQAGGHYNHSLFWQMMSPTGGGQPGGALEKALLQRYGSFQAFVDEFSAQAASLFGSGWVWLQPDLSIVTSANQDSPLTPPTPLTQISPLTPAQTNNPASLLTADRAPILGLDVWEHAYYLDYQNRRPDYIKAWWDVVNWQFIAERYATHM